MCGRFALRDFYMDRVANEYPDIPPRRWDDEGEAIPPASNVVVPMQQPNAGGQQELVLHTARWGLQAKWCDPSSFSHKNPINARSDVVLEGTANIWNSVRGSKHCIVICEGYYEWLKRGTRRSPHYVKHPQNQLLLLAGFYEIVKPTSGSARPTYTCTILTTEANPQLAFLHDRMPVILSSEQALRWMDVSKGWKPEVLEELSKPYEGELVCYEVPPGVGKVGTEDPSFVEPITERKDGLRAMMSKMVQKPKETDHKPKLESSPSKPTKRESIHILSEDDEEDKKPKVEPKPEMASPVPRRVGSSSARSIKRGASSPIEVDLVKSESEVSASHAGVRASPKKKRKTQGRGSSPVDSQALEKSARPSDKKTITDFFGKK
ncbi:DUF159-domain-containing protein [Ceratobasidium sp. AG-I]|nr:DUF159-domain-containing protein [Ceratobasidium sp. AG-I]